MWDDVVSLITWQYLVTPVTTPGLIVTGTINIRSWRACQLHFNLPHLILVLRSLTESSMKCLGNSLQSNIQISYFVLFIRRSVNLSDLCNSSYWVTALYFIISPDFKLPEIILTGRQVKTLLTPWEHHKPCHRSDTRLLTSLPLLQSRSEFLTR